MNIYGYHYKNIRPLSGVYADDASITLKSHRIATAEGLDSYFIEALSAGRDVAYNNHNQMWLTEKKDRSQYVEHKIKKSQYPYFRTTYLKVSGTDLYVVTDGSTGAIAVTGTAADIGNHYYYELEFTSNRLCYVRRTYNNTLKYLTATLTNSAALTFTSRVTGENRKEDRQAFEYIFDENGGTLTLFAHISSPAPGGPANTSIPLLIQNHIAYGTALSAKPLPSTSTFINSGCKFYVEPRPVTTPELYSVGTSWTQYVSSVDKNNNNISINNTSTNQRNNYLVHTCTNNLGYSAHQLLLDTIPLKSLLTPTGENSKDNPYSGTETTNDHRNYSKLFTGSNQENGYESIYMNYESGVHQVLLPADKLTYFHAPQNLTPYTKLNINDTFLYRIGAIPSDTPIKSDKIFKEARKSRNNIQNRLVPKNTELYGTWLCSWLSGNSDPGVIPIWVDRYYNPDFYTQSEALSAGIITPVLYVDNFTYKTQVIGATAEHIRIYDKVSDLTIEPGILYAYHHVGEGNSQRVIDSLSNNLLTKNLYQYRQNNMVDKAVKYDYDGPTHTMSSGATHTGYKHTPKSIEVLPSYDFNADSYGSTASVSHQGSFTLSFWMHCTNWGDPFGNQVIGNFLMDGFGVYNKDYITPLIMIPSDKHVLVYNSEFEYLQTFNLEKKIAHFTKKGNLENFWIVDDSNSIYEYAANGTVKNKITDASVSTKAASSPIADIDIKDSTLYVLFTPPMTGDLSDAHYFKYDMSSKTSGYTGTFHGTKIWNYDAAISPASGASIFAVTNGVSASTGHIVLIHDSLSARTSDTHNVSGSIPLGTTCMVDNSGNPWSLQGNKIYTYDPVVSSNITALSSQHIIESIGCDSSNNIWVLHSNIKATKLNNERKHVFTTTLSGLSSAVVYNRNIDFISEFDSEGNYKEFCFTTNQSISGCKFVRISLDGADVSEINALSGTSPITSPITFFNTPMSACKTSTGHSYIRRHARDDQQQIKAKLKLSRQYNASTTTESYDTYTLTYNVSSFKPGWAHFAIAFNAEKGLYEMYINTTKVASQSIPQGAYSKSDPLNRPLTVGAAPFYTKSFLAEHLNQSTRYLCKNLKIKNIYLYSTALDYFDIKQHYDVNQPVSTIKWNIPMGQRNYLDTIERTFSFKVPGRRSELYDVNVYNTQLTDYNLKKDIETFIIENVESNVPAYTKLHSIMWDGQSLSANTASVPPSITNINTPTSNVYIQGGTYTYD